MSKAKSEDYKRPALALFFDEPEEGKQPPPDLHRGHRGRRRQDEPATQDDDALRLWLMANSPARALRIIAEYADQNARECTADREFPAAGVWTQFAVETRKVHQWALDFVELV